MNQDFVVQVADESHTAFAETICKQIEESAQARGTGIAKRSPEYISNKMCEGKAVIAFERGTGKWAGFCYIEDWSHGKYVANSGLIVSPDFRGTGLAKKIKHEVFKLSRRKFPDAKIFGLTTGLAVMKMNSELGYKPVTYSELTDDDAFWKGCQSCVNYDILMSKNRKVCLCTAMLYDPHEQQDDQNDTAQTKSGKNGQAQQFKNKLRIYERFMRMKQNILLKLKPAKDNVVDKDEKYIPALINKADFRKKNKKEKNKHT